MKKTFVYKVTKAALWVLHMFGASAFLLTVMALCGVPMNFWVGVCTVLPGWLIIKGLLNLCGREIMKAMENGAHERFVIVKDGKDDDCRFHEGGKCTYGDGLPECAKEMKAIDSNDTRKKYWELHDSALKKMREGKHEDFWNGVCAGINWCINIISERPNWDTDTVFKLKRNVVHCPNCWRTYPNIGGLIICDCGAEIEPKEGNQ